MTDYHLHDMSLTCARYNRQMNCRDYEKAHSKSSKFSVCATDVTGNIGDGAIFK